MVIIHDKDGNRLVMTYKEAIAAGYIKQPTVTWSEGINNNKPIGYKALQIVGKNKPIGYEAPYTISPNHDVR